MSKLIYVEDDYDGRYGRFLENLGQVVRDRKEFLENPQSFDLIMFTGGADVSPNLYGHRNLASGCDPRRDDIEQEVFNLALHNNIPMFSICRGAQFTSSLLGGTMVQHLRDSHGGGVHGCETIDGESFEVTSSHHQMIVPGEEGQILAWAQERLNPESCIYDGELPEVLFDPEDPNKIRVTEIVYYPNNKVLCCQSHPEWQNSRDPFPQYILGLARELCWNQEQVLSQGE